MAGIPSFKAIFQSKDFLKRMILDRLLNKWKTAVMPKTDLKLKKSEASGIKRIDEPNPLIVPIISAIKSNIKKSI